MFLLIYTGLGILLVCQALSFALYWTQRPRHLQRAFENLEMDFEDLRDHVASQLGRISRLKRTTLELTQEKEPPDIPAVDTGGFRLTPQQRKLQEQILARRGNHEVKQ